MKYTLTYQRNDSMSVSEAVGRIKINTSRCKDSCARKFAEALMKLAPELTFWQNVPPDKEDLSSAQSAQLTDFLCHAISERHDMDARTIGPWIYDVYAGSKKKETCGNKWDDAYPFSYKNGLDNSRLPLPLMKDFRANQNIMLSICNAVIAELNTKKPKSAHMGSAFVNEAAEQVAAEFRNPTDRKLSQRVIENGLRQFVDNEQDWRRPIHQIDFVSSADTDSALGKHYSYDVMVVTWAAEDFAYPTKVVSLEVFARKIRGLLN